MHHATFLSRYFVGRGLDVGCGDDPLSRYQSLFPLVTELVDHDWPQGDAQELALYGAGTFDFLHSSHCLEHVRDPWTALRRWCEVVKPGGYLVVLIPDEDMYEQGAWPSRFNGDHKHTFTAFKLKSWSPVSVNVVELATAVSDLASLVRLEVLHGTQLPEPAGTDQTLNPVSESAIEFVLRRH